MKDVHKTSTPASEAALSLLEGGHEGGSGGDEPFERFEHERYRIGARLGQGGMGRVFVAHDLRLDRDVALKEVLRPEPGLAERLRREARLTAALDHPGITPIYDAGRRDDGRLYYTMRLVRGRPLSEVIAEVNRPSSAPAQRPSSDARHARGEAGPEIEPKDRAPAAAEVGATGDLAGDASASDARRRAGRERLIRIVLEAARAVAFAHARGILHRDLKPDNIMVAELGDTQVADWGLACRVDDPDAGLRAGTPGFMAPEVEAGGRATTRSDVWSLGRILACGLGLDARASATPLSRPPLAPPDELLAIVRRAGAARPEARYASAGELAADLERYLSGERVHAHAYSAWALARRLIRMWRVPLAVAGVALVVTAVAVLMAWQATTDERDRAVAAEVDAERARAQDALRLAALLRTQAVEAEARGAFAEAGLMAARSFELKPSPEARALLMALGASGTPTREADARTATYAEGMRPIHGSRDLLHLEDHRVRRIAPDGSVRWESPGQAVLATALDQSEAPDGARASEGGAGEGRYALLQLVDRIEVLELDSGHRWPVGPQMRYGASFEIDATRDLALDGNRGIINLWDIGLDRSRLGFPGQRPLLFEVPACGPVDMLGTALLDPRATGHTSGAAEVLAVCHDSTLQLVGEFGGSTVEVVDPTKLLSRTSTLALRGELLVVGTLEGELAVVRLGTAPRVDLISRRAELGRIESILLSPGDPPRYAMVQAQRDGPRIVDLTARVVALTLPKSDRGAAAWRDDDVLATVGMRPAAWRVPSPASPHRLNAVAGIGSLASSPDGRLVAAAGAEGSIAVFDLETGQRTAYRSPIARVIKQVAFSPDGSQLAVGGMGSDDLWIIDRATGAARGLETIGSIRRLGWLPSGALYALAFGPDVRFWASSTASPREFVPRPLIAPPETFGWIDTSNVPAEDRALLLDGFGWVWTLSEAGLEPTPIRSRALALAALGKDLVALAEGARLAILDTAGQVVREVPLTSTTVELVASPDGRHLASSDTRGRVEVRQTSDLALVAGLEAHRERAAALSWGTRRLVSGAWDGSLRVWNPEVLERAPSSADLERLWGLSVDALDAVR
ncbi:MAG: protein kinase [Deltaproteobacteria bacterium]|nr:protein kinase [Deltaproteobacteria bacterium]